jgi:hypothetical protein
LTLDHERAPHAPLGSALDSEFTYSSLGIHINSSTFSILKPLLSLKNNSRTPNTCSSPLYAQIVIGSQIRPPLACRRSFYSLSTARQTFALLYSIDCPGQVMLHVCNFAWVVVQRSRSSKLWLLMQEPNPSQSSTQGAWVSLQVVTMI